MLDSLGPPSQRLFGVLLAPVGSVSRALLSKYLNGRPRCAVAFPGTLIANVLGTFVGSVNGGYIHNNGPYRSVILGVLDIGLGGTLSTVSTYVKEVNVLSEKQKVRMEGEHSTIILLSSGGVLSRGEEDYI